MMHGRSGCFDARRTNSRWTGMTSLRRATALVCLPLACAGALACGGTDAGSGGDVVDEIARTTDVGIAALHIRYKAPKFRGVERVLFVEHDAAELAPVIGADDRDFARRQLKLVRVVVGVSDDA